MNPFQLGHRCKSIACMLIDSFTSTGNKHAGGPAALVPIIVWCGANASPVGTGQVDAKCI